jgi:hypothetical protein
MRRGNKETRCFYACLPVPLSPCLLVFLSMSLCLCGSVANSFAPISPQADSQPQERRAQGGASTAGAFKPVKDSSARPITAGGFVDGARETVDVKAVDRMITLTEDKDAK